MCFARLQPVLWQGRQMCVVPKKGVTRLNLFRQLDRVSQHIQMFGSSMKFAVSPQGSTWQLRETCPTHTSCWCRLLVRLCSTARVAVCLFHTGVVNDVSLCHWFRAKVLCCVTISCCVPPKDMVDNVPFVYQRACIVDVLGTHITTLF